MHCTHEPLTLLLTTGPVYGRVQLHGHAPILHGGDPVCQPALPRVAGAVCDLADEGPPATLVARLATRDAAQRALSGDCDIPAGLLQVWTRVSLSLELPLTYVCSTRTVLALGRPSLALLTHHRSRPFAPHARHAYVRQAVWEDNEEFWRESAAFDPAYLRFVKALTVA